MQKFYNYGDQNFFERGALVSDAEGSTYRVLYCMPVDGAGEENRFLFADCYVDGEDSWINKEDVERCSGKPLNWKMFAVDCIDYYGVENFDAAYDRESRIMTSEEIREYLAAVGVLSDSELDVDFDYAA